MKSSDGALLVIWIEKVFILGYHEKNRFTNSSDNETATREINLKKILQTPKSPKHIMASKDQ